MLDDHARQPVLEQFERGYLKLCGALFVVTVLAAILTGPSLFTAIGYVLLLWHL